MPNLTSDEKIRQDNIYNIFISIEGYLENIELKISEEERLSDIVASLEAGNKRVSREEALKHIERNSSEVLKSDLAEISLNVGKIYGKMFLLRIICNFEDTISTLNEAEKVGKKLTAGQTKEKEKITIYNNIVKRCESIQESFFRNKNISESDLSSLISYISFEIGNLYTSCLYLENYFGMESIRNRIENRER